MKLAIELGWTPYQYYTSSPYEFLAASEGYFDKLDREERLVRKQTLYIIASNGAKVKRPEDLWEVFGDREVVEEKLVMTKELLAQIKAKHNIK